MASPPETQSRRAKILTAAADLFYVHSFAAVGMDAIGQRAGLTGPAIYRYFSGKDEILATLFDEALDGLVAATGQSFDEPWEEFEYLVRGHVTFLLEQRKLAGVKVREERSLSGSSQQRLHARERRYVGRWLSCVARCTPDLASAEQASAAHAALGMVNSIAMWPASALHSTVIPDQLAATAVGGLRAAAGLSAARH